MCPAHRWSYVRHVTTARGLTAIVLVLAAGLVGCTDDDAATDAGATVAADATATTVAPATTEPAATADDDALRAAFEFAQCMRDNGIEDFADPQVRADGDFFLSPPADVADEELNDADEACEDIAAAFRNEPGTAVDDE